MDDLTDYRKLYESEARLRKEAEAARKEAETARKEAETAHNNTQQQLDNAQQQLDNAQQQLDNAQQQLDNAQQQLAKTSFPDFLRVCHDNVFMSIDVEKNELLTTGGGLTRVDGKQYPRCLKPWADFGSRHEASFVTLEQAFQQRMLFPSPAGLEYLAFKLRDKRLASEADLKTFECLAVEGCALDVLPNFFELVHSGAATSPVTDAPSEVTFNNYPFGVVATASDEEAAEDVSEQDDVSSAPLAFSRSRSRGRGRGRTRSRSRVAATTGRKKPLKIKMDRPAYIAALGVAKEDMDAAMERAEAEEEARSRPGSFKKRSSPERGKAYPDQWCFRHSVDSVMRPLFVVEYKAAHKVNGHKLRRFLEPNAAESLIEDVIRVLSLRSAGKNTEKKDGDKRTDDDDFIAKHDIAKVITQTFHYMVDYGLQYSYATTGYALIFFYLDPAEPTTMYYHLEEPQIRVHSSSRDDIKHSAVALVLAFVLMSLTGQYMTHRWKKMFTTQQPTWPTPYPDMDVPRAQDSNMDLRVLPLAPALAADATSDSCRDPEKQNPRYRRRDQDDDDEDGGNGADPSHTTRSGVTAATSTASAQTPSQKRPAVGTKQSSTQAPSDAATTPDADGRTVSAWAWSRPVDAPPTPALDYCTQACLGGLKSGGVKDPHCPNVVLHRRRREGADDNDADDADDADDSRHPISAEQLRMMLQQQLAEDMDQDFMSLERFGMYGAMGALFKMALSAYGYCFVGKGVQRAHRLRLAKEAAVYDILTPCQGQLVPVNLGVVELVDEYWTECGAHISHLMLMAFAGESLWHIAWKDYEDDKSQRHVDVARYEREMQRTLEDLTVYGVDHGDTRDANLVWSEELQRVLAIDFDRAVVSRPQETAVDGRDETVDPDLTRGRKRKRDEPSWAESTRA